MLSLSLVSQFLLGPSLHARPGGCLLCLLRCEGLLPCLLCTGGLLSHLLHPGGLLSRLLCPGGPRSRLLRPGGLLSRLLSPGGLQFRPGGLQSCLLCPGGLRSRLFRPGGLQSRLLYPGGLRFRLLRLGTLLCRLGLGSWSWHFLMDLALRPSPRFCHESGCPSTSWTLALHSLLHSTSDYNSHHSLN